MERGSAPRLFGTNGIRGVPNRDLTVEFAQSIGKSIGTFFRAREVAMGRDTRLSGQMIMGAVQSGLNSTGTDTVDLGILPTPALQYYCKNTGMPGVMITASHNPPQYNGIKCIDSDGSELAREKEREIEVIHHSGQFHSADWNSVGRNRWDSTAEELYVRGVASRVSVDRIRASAFRVALDTGNGASYRTSPELLSRYGASVTTLNSNPDGLFTARPSEPVEANLKALISTVRSGGYDLGVAHDGDADRCVFVDERGQFVDGDRSLALIVRHTARNGDVVVTPVSTSDAIEEVCSEVGARVVRTVVGAPVVIRTMIETGARVGGEENGGVIFGPHQYCRDGAMTMSLVLDLMARTGRKLSELLKEVPEYHMFKASVERKKPWEEVLPLVLKYAEGRKVDRTDGVKVFHENGWVLLRPSGTEAIIRIYAQSRDRGYARELGEEYREFLEGAQLR